MSTVLRVSTEVASNPPDLSALPVLGGEVGFCMVWCTRSITAEDGNRQRFECKLEMTVLPFRSPQKSQRDKKVGLSNANRRRKRLQLLISMEVALHTARPVREELYNDRTQARADARNQEANRVPSPFLSTLSGLTSGGHLAMLLTSTY